MGDAQHRQIRAAVHQEDCRVPSRELASWELVALARLRIRCWRLLPKRKALPVL